MRLTEQKKQMKNKNKNANAGQISIEALLLWAALAGMIALFTPAFAQTMNAYSLLAQTNQFTAFADELQSNVEWLSFAGEGSQIRVRVPMLNEMKIITRANEIELTFDDETFSHPKVRTITSEWLIDGTFQAGETITLVREEGKITIR